MSIKITLNDKDYQTSSTTIKELVLELIQHNGNSVDVINLEDSHYAVAVNGKIIPKSNHSECKLNDNDVVDVYSLLAGG